MKKQTKKLLAGLLAVIMLLTLLPMAIIGPFAEEVEEATYDGPALNKTIVGTVKFQSFNFLGKNETNDDGVDYESTFYYTDDYFSHSAINDAVTEQSVPWTELDDTSLATTSMDLAAASFATGAGNVKSASSKTWANTDYSDRAANAREFLTACGFDGFEAVDYDHAPTRDSVAYVMANKKIHVWDEATQSNKDFTLVAVGVRGASYGSEWASNVEVGDSSNPAAKNTPHQGFHKSAEKVVAGVKQYIADNNIDGNVKYWVSGFSRAAAVANLTAAYITDRAEEFGTAQKDIYGYTWECPQAAETAKNALDYKNIHNIVNAMDVVPMVSPSVFEHQRLGVDYVMPYYKNTTSSENTMYYNRMYDVLKTIAVGTTYRDGTYEEDRLIADLNPSVYPYNRPVPIYTIKALQLIEDAASKNIENFGTVQVSGSDNKLGNVYLDEFLNNVLKVCLSSNAWDRDSSTQNTSNTDIYLQHKERYAEKYQTAFMDAFDYFLTFSGPAFMDMVDAVVNGVMGQLSIKDAYFASAFMAFYQKPTSKFSWTDVINPTAWWVGRFSWFNKSRKEVLIEEAKPVVKEVVHNMVSDYEKEGGHPRVSLTQLDNAMELLVEVLIDLYADELSVYNSNYFGTTLHYLFNILSMHEQETVLSWITALDDNHINRGYRTLTLPANTNVKLLEFREQFEGPASFDGYAPVVAEYNSGNEVKNLDQRIYAEKNGDNLIIRYPASLDIRADVSTKDDTTTVEHFVCRAADFQTNAITTGVEDASQYAKLNDNDLYTEITNDTGKTNANEVVNSQSDELPLLPGETYQIIANGTSTYDNSAPGDSDVYSTNKKVRVTWANDDGSVLKTENVDLNTVPSFGDEDPKAAQAAPAKQEYVFTGWSPEVGAVTTPTTFTATYKLQEKLRTAHTLTLEGDIGVNFYYYLPARYEGEKALAFVYKGQPKEGLLEETTNYGYTHKTTYTVAAKEMSEPITATLSSDGTVINEHDYSVMRYANLALQNPKSFKPELLDLAKSMLYYGACAQQYFDYNLDNLANAGVNYKAPSIEVDSIPIAEFDKASVNEGLAKYGLEYHASNLTLESKTTLRLFFYATEAFDPSLTATVNGTPTEFVARNNEYCLEIPNVSAKNIGDIKTITIGDVTFKYSVLNYINNALKGNNEELKDTVTALYDYYLKAKAYFKVLNG